MNVFNAKGNLISFNMFLYKLHKKILKRRREKEWIVEISIRYSPSQNAFFKNSLADVVSKKTNFKTFCIHNEPNAENILVWEHKLTFCLYSNVGDCTKSVAKISIAIFLFQFLRLNKLKISINKMGKKL